MLAIAASGGPLAGTAIAQVSAPVNGASQTPPAAAPPAAPVSVTTGPDGFAIQSASGDFRLQLGLLLQADARFALADADEQHVDNFSLRRLRPSLRGRVSRRFEFYLNPDFVNGTFVVQDAYVDTVFSPAFRVRAGKGKTPFGFERLHSASNLLFMERAFPTALVPNRDIGVQVLGDIAGGLVSYLAGVMNGVADGGSADIEADDGKDLSGRFVVRPFNRRLATSPLKGLGLAISGSTGTATGVAALPTFRTQTLQQAYFAYAGGTDPAVADGTRTRYSPQIWYFYKAFGGWGEYVHTTTPVTRTTVVKRDIDHDAWQVAASWVLTGEAATDAGVGVRPRNNFDFGNGSWGAFQVAARYHVLEVDRDAIALGLATAGASRKAQGWTAGLRWYLNPNLWYTVNFVRTVFDGNPAGPRRAENGIAVRTQLDF